MCERISAFNIPMSFNEVWTIVSNAKNASPIAVKSTPKLDVIYMSKMFV